MAQIGGTEFNVSCHTAATRMGDAGAGLYAGGDHFVSFRITTGTAFMLAHHISVELGSRRGAGMQDGGDLCCRFNRLRHELKSEGGYAGSRYHRVVALRNASCTPG